MSIRRLADDVVQDIRYGLRTLARAMVATTAAVNDGVLARARSA